MRSVAHPPHMIPLRVPSDEGACGPVHSKYVIGLNYASVFNCLAHGWDSILGSRTELILSHFLFSLTEGAREQNVISLLPGKMGTSFFNPERLELTVETRGRQRSPKARKHEGNACTHVCAHTHSCVHTQGNVDTEVHTQTGKKERECNRQTERGWTYKKGESGLTETGMEEKGREGEAIEK